MNFEANNMDTETTESALAMLSLQNKTENEPKDIIKRKKKKTKK